jgi:formate-dependent nitrite reductase membrane component NrfD
MMVAALTLLVLSGVNGPSSGALNALFGIAAPVVGGFFVALTLVLLIADLKRPDRALYIMLKSNPTSWLVWGAYILGLLGLVEAIWFVAALLRLAGVIGALLIPAMLFGAAGAGYTAFLFGQAEGRDFWQSPLLLPALLVQALIGGAAALGLLAWALNAGGPTSSVGTLLAIVLLVALALHVLLVLIEVLGAHTNRHVARAAHYMSRGPLKEMFWGQFLVIGSILPIAILTIALIVPAAQSVLLAFAAVLAIAGLFVYEYCFVKAGQSVPLS